MNVDYVIRQLDNAAAWSELSNVLGGDNIPVVRGVIRYLRIINVVCYVVESRYIDRDYSSDYLRFYAQTFRSYDPCLSGYHPHPLYVVCLLGLQARAGAGALRRRSG